MPSYKIADLSMSFVAAFSWDRLPALRLLLPFVLGIIAVSFLPAPLRLPLPLAISAVALFVLLSILVQKDILLRYGFVWGIGASLLMGILGYSFTLWHTEIRQDNHFAHLLPNKSAPTDNTQAVVNDSAFVLLQLLEPLSAGAKTYRALAEVVAVQAPDSTWKPSIGKAMLYFELDSAASALRYGDIVLSNAPLRRTSPPQNPDEFDYKQYLQRQNIWHQAYISDVFWRYTGINRASAWRAAIFKGRNYCVEMTRRYVGDNANGGLAAAMLIGYTRLLDDDMRQLYAQTGVAHVIAVSGMHVGILAAIFAFLLGFLRRWGRVGAVLYYVLLISVVWLFTLVTGATPSAVRAAVMFTLFLGGIWYGRRTIFYNILAASALGILLFDPQVLFHIGFQLSYAAVLGIVMFQQPIRNLWYPPNRGVAVLWSIISVTIAAQVFTTPLVLYYFHQFPVFFVLANIVAVPVSTIVLGVGILLLPLSLIADMQPVLTVLPHYCGMAISFALDWLNGYLSILGRLPGASWSGFAPTVAGVVLFYGFIVGIVAYLRTAYIRYLQYALLLGIVAMAGNAIKQYQQQQQRGINIYAIKNGMGIDFIDGRHAVYIADSIGMLSTKQQQHIQNHRYTKGITVVEQLPLQLSLAASYQHQTLADHLYLNGNMARFYDKTICLYDTTAARYQPNESISVDYLLLTQNPRIDLKQLRACVAFKTVVVDASNSNWRSRLWQQQCRDMDIACHIVKEQGALMLQF